MIEKKPSSSPADSQNASASFSPAPDAEGNRKKALDHVIKAPSISLPKGGGAIKGIGEKFSVNPSNGTASMEVPIFTSPGRSDFGPKLSLSYNSGAGNGPFGWGWGLSIPSITRKTDKGLPRYHDGEESDVFILSGAEDLVPLLEYNAADDTWQRHEQSRPVNGETYRVNRYRPRIEGLFARIEKWTNERNGVIHWRSISRDNITTIYGSDEFSRIADPQAQDKRIFSWLISKNFDDKGNAVVYEYVKEDSRLVDTAHPSERNRTDSSRSADRYLKRIKYGNRTSRLVDPDLQNPQWMFEVVFDYGEGHVAEDAPDADGRIYATSSIGPQNEWSARPDPFSSYRSGFEVRTYRLCRKVLMYHHFPEQLSPDDYLVRSTEFQYESNTDISATDREKEKQRPYGMFIRSISQNGFVYDSGKNKFLKKSFPPVEFEYTRFTRERIFSEYRIQNLDRESLENLPAGLSSGYQLADLDGEGLSGILTEEAGTWYYKPNCGDGTFGPLNEVTPMPSTGTLQQGSRLLDLAGDGTLDVVSFSGDAPGFYERTGDSNWKSHRPFTSIPAIDYNDPNLQFVDLNGDGHADILVTECDLIRWYPSIGEEGFSEAQFAATGLDEEQGPRVVFADGTQSIQLADLSGDGLSDLVRIRNGEICYWPNLGYGRFGAKVTMANAPRFESDDLYDPGRLKLADIDGTGTTDIIYLASDGIHIYFNQSGNGWSDVAEGPLLPIDNICNVFVADLLGKGTACLIWSSPSPGYAKDPIKYVDLMEGEKPHLLKKVANNLGAETEIFYASSTKFYLDDKKAGKPWITKIPFPVHVVERSIIHDCISGNLFTTKYAYHHGYFDGEEREFRGFGMVEQQDTEEYGFLEELSAGYKTANIDAGSHVPPVLTKTWFHTGAFIEAGKISRHFENEYYHEGDESLGEGGLSEAQRKALLVDDTVLPTTIRLPDDTTISWEDNGNGIREAYRALKGSILRQEIYGLDDTEAQDRPYTVSERNFTIEVLQPRAGNRHAVFFTHPRETVTFNYERALYDVNGTLHTDPRISHEFILAVDRFGNVEKSASVAYGRRFPRTDPLLTPDDHECQTAMHIVCNEMEFTKNHIDTDDAWRTPVQWRSSTWEVRKHGLDSGVIDDIRPLIRFDAIREKLDAEYTVVPYENHTFTGMTDDKPWRRLVERLRVIYLDEQLKGPLPPETVAWHGLPYETYKQAFTPGLITEIYGMDVTDDDLLNKGKYTRPDGETGWWIGSGRIHYAPADTAVRDHAEHHFFLPCRYEDPFGNTTTVTYDTYDLLPLESEDALQNKVTVGERDDDGIIYNCYDYRTLQPTLITDPNGNRTAAISDALGMVAATAEMGRRTETVGSSLAGIEPNLPDATVLEHIDNPLSNPSGIIKRASTRLIYNLFAYQRTCNPDKPFTYQRTCNSDEPSPPVVYTIARETYDETSKFQHSFTFSDGFGREIQKKIQAEKGKTPKRDKNGKIIVDDQGEVEWSETECEHRWVGSGWTVLNNKGKPVRQYEPFFTDTHAYDDDVRIGVSPTIL